MRTLGWGLMIGGALISAGAFALFWAGVMAFEVPWLQQHATARFRGMPLTPLLCAALALLGLPLGLFTLEVARDHAHDL